jgi:hypothetical protein
MFGMRRMCDPVLGTAEINQFVHHGYVVVKNCFSPDTARHWVEEAFVKQSYSIDDPSTWDAPYVSMEATKSVDLKAFSPKAVKTIWQLLGGESRVSNKISFSDHFVINFSWNANQPWRAPSNALGTWHLDAWEAGCRHFLNSPELALVLIVMWTDVAPRSGGTFISSDSIGPVTRHLLEHPEGVLNKEETNNFFGDLIFDFHSFVELTGRVGDIAFMHPYTLHAQSDNPSGHARVITNEHIQLSEPMHFNRASSLEYSPVERAVLDSLEVQSVDFERSTACQ